MQHDNVSIGGQDAWGHFALYFGSYHNRRLLATGFFERSRSKVRSMQAYFGSRTYTYDWRHRFDTKSEHAWHGVFSKINLGSDYANYCLLVSGEIGESLVLTDKGSLNRSVYDYLMNHYQLPLLEEWIPYLLRTGYVSEHSVECTGADILVPIGQNQYPVSDLKVLDFSQMSETLLECLVSEGLKKKKIMITSETMEPLKFENFDDYIEMYGSSLVKNLEDTLEPLVPLKGKVDGLALLTKRPFPQQAACINGANAIFNKGRGKLAILNEGMGVGKTLQGASIVESYYVEKYLREHPDKTLKDVYSDEHCINYRAIIMPPGHLVEKWAQELREEIPYAKPIILSDLSQLVELRARGRKERCGKEFYIIGKDFCKLGTQEAPIPTQVKMQYVSFSACSDCLQDGKIVYRQGSGSNAACPSCKGKNFTPVQQKGYGKMRGMICHSCGELLLKNSGGSFQKKAEEDDELLEKSILTPDSFASRKNENSKCFHCGAALWGAHVKPLGNVTSRKKWYKVSHFSNHTHKGTSTAFVLKGYEKDYYDTVITTAGLRETMQEYGPRKVAPSKYIKKYLKGYFDFCILDECHKYAGGGTAQGNAAQSISRTSTYTLGLTGTISNGTAESFFYLFWMLAPRKMVRAGYTFSRESLMSFCYKYGSVETLYERNESWENGTYNNCSRGRQLGSPRVKPGISPVLFSEMLLDCCLYLDISDMSKFLPPLIEKVETVALPNTVNGAYHSTIGRLKDAMWTPEGSGAKSYILQVGLSYPDKPFGRTPIMSSVERDYVLAAPRNFDAYRSLDELMPKEEKLIEIIKQEMSEGRNVFVYASFTGKEETNVTERLKALIERKCNLSGRVEIIQSTSPAARKREEYFHKRAAEGIKVFITNPKNVETGLDFCFKHKGKQYNYPTLIFYQISYELSVMWQASRRAYRLNQREECRTYYLAYEGTLQTAALEIMAAKQVATSAIQGKFSTQGLFTMAKGVDARTQLAAALAEGDFSSKESLDNMFDVLNTQRNDTAGSDGYDDYVPPATFYELVELPQKQSKVVQLQSNSLFDDFDDFFNDSNDSCEKKTVSYAGLFSFVSSEESVDDFLEGNADSVSFLSQSKQTRVRTTEYKKKSTKKAAGMYSLFDL